MANVAPADGGNKWSETELRKFRALNLPGQIFKMQVVAKMDDMALVDLVDENEQSLRVYIVDRIKARDLSADNEFRTVDTSPATSQHTAAVKPVPRESSVSRDNETKPRQVKVIGIWAESAQRFFVHTCNEELTKKFKKMGTGLEFHCEEEEPVASSHLAVGDKVAVYSDNFR